MPLPSLEKTWQYDVNNVQAVTGTTLTTMRQLWRAIKDGLLAFGTLPWIVEYSCDSAVAGSAGDNVDRWDSDTDLVWQAAASGTARSWFVFSNADGVQMLWECRAQTTTTGKSIAIYMSPAAGFTGGTTTQRPTATDEIPLVTGDSSTASHCGAGQASNTTDFAFAWHILHSTDGLVTMVVICQGGNCSGFWYFGRVSQPVTGWTTPVVHAVFGGLSGTSPGAITYNETADKNSTTAANLRTGALFNAVEADWFPAGIALGAGAANSSEPGGRVILVANEISSEWELPQVSIACSVSGARGMAHGRLFDVRWVSSARAAGDTFPGDGSRTRVVMGPFVIPWNGSVPLAA
jgi:hypothetical protein